MQTVNLKNGSQEVSVAVSATMLSLDTLFERHPIDAYELVEKCRNPNHKIFGNCGESLRALNLLSSDGRVHDTVRNIVLSAVSGEGFDMVLNSPIAK